MADAQQVKIAPLRGDALRRAIVAPAENVGVCLEDSLVERLLADADDEPGALPMLQEALVLLWGRRQRRIIARRSYDELGRAGHSGLAVAMATRADATLAELPSEAEQIARRIFLRLVQFGEGRPDTRRQLTVAELRSKGDDSQVFDRVLATLIDHRLLTPSADERLGRRVDIAHEMLIIGWPASRVWAQARRDAEQTRRRLAAKADEWIPPRPGRWRPPRPGRTRRGRPLALQSRCRGPRHRRRCAEADRSQPPECLGAAESRTKTKETASGGIRVLRGRSHRGKYHRDRSPH